MLSFLKTTHARLLTLLLLAEIVTFYAYPKAEKVLLSRPLRDVPAQIASWRMVEEIPLETDVQELLKADDYLNRVYVDDHGQQVSLYVAFFKTQQTGVAPHSPMVCLPGNGWVPQAKGSIPLSVSGMKGAVYVNRYVVAKGDYKSVVLYWYQTHNRVIASEYAAKIFTVLDSIQYRRSDTSLVRVVVPAIGSTERADKVAVSFAETIFNPLREYLPR